MGAGSCDDGWRVERACALAWPARDEVAVGGWRVSRSGGGTRRANSASPADADAQTDDATIAAIRDAYAAVAQPVIVRVPTLMPAVDALLDRHGFAPAEGHTLTIACDAPPRRGDDAVRLSTVPDAAWIAARRALSVAAWGGAEDHLAPIGRLTVPAVFAALEAEGAVRSLAFAAVHDGVAIVEAVATDAAWRGRGLARRNVSALLHATAAVGAHCAALQVMADNLPARALYRAIGFDRHLYDYHYRRSPA